MIFPYIHMITMISLVTICQHTNTLHNSWWYSPHCTLHPLTHLFCNWKFVLLNLPHLFISSPNPTPFCLFSVSMSLFLFCYVCPLFCFLDSTYNWNSMVFVFSWLISLSMIPSGSIHVVTNGKVSFFFMAELYSIVYICQVFFIDSSIDGHLDCFRILAMVSNTAVNTAVHSFFLVSVFVVFR